MLQMSVIFIVLYAFKPITVEGHFHKNLFPDVHTSEFVKMIGTDFSLDGKFGRPQDLIHICSSNRPQSCHAVLSTLIFQMVKEKRRF